MADKQVHDAGGNAQQAGDASRAGGRAAQQRKRDEGGTAQVTPGSRAGSNKRQGAGGGASVNGPGGADSGSDAMPGGVMRFRGGWLS